MAAGQTPLRFTVSAAGAAGGVLEVAADLELPFEQPRQDDLARAEIDVSEDDRASSTALLDRARGQAGAEALATIVRAAATDPWNASAREALTTTLA